MDNRRSSGGIEFENLKATELRLGLPGTDDKLPTLSQKRALNVSEIDQPVAKAQAVGWPPVRNNRRSSFLAKKTETEANGIFVKVSMDGAPYLRKLDLKTCKGYKELREELNNMFSCTISLEHAIAYEDKDGDLMLVGDVPWCMFISSCKKLRVMKGSEARGLNIDQ